MLFHVIVVFCYQNWSAMTYCEKKLISWSRETFEIQGWRPRICKFFEIVNCVLLQRVPLICKLVNFIHSEKTTNFCKISTVDLSYVVAVKSMVEISQNFVAFSEYMNFTSKYVQVPQSLKYQRQKKSTKNCSYNYVQ